MGTVAITARATLPSGTVLTASTSVTIAAGMLIGSDREPIDMTVYPKMAYTRIYNEPGKGLKTLPSTLATCVMPHVSFKDTPTAALVNPFLTALNRPCWLEYNHEPEGDMTAAAYINGVKALIALVRAHPNGHWVKVPQTFTGYAQRHGTKTMTDGTLATIGNLYAGADVIGLDCEVDSSIVGFPAYASFFAPLIAAMRTYGVLGAVPELGWPVPASDTDGSQTAAWYTGAAAYLRSAGVAAVAAYDFPGSTGNYVLTGKPLAAWQALVANQ